MAEFMFKDLVKKKGLENDFYIEFNHEMTKEHFISFVAYVGYDRILTVRLYPEQSATVRFPKMYRGKLYFYCSNHGLFEYKIWNFIVYDSSAVADLKK